jgi:cystathionine beta-lyase/cystathionine gamma-synthase
VDLCDRTNDKAQQELYKTELNSQAGSVTSFFLETVKQACDSFNNSLHKPNLQNSLSPDSDDTTDAPKNPPLTV